jgi:predicted CoA-substrate-specific enzyme activase
MIVGGVDIGSTTGKAVVMKDGEIVSSHLISATINPQTTAQVVMDEAIARAGLPSIDHLDNVVSTGYGRLKISFALENVSEISCHAKGAHWMAPDTRTVVDIGGQDCKVISVSEKGTVLNFVMNDRCAAGTGRFFEAMARALSCGLEGLSSLDNQGEKACIISNQCSVFAESEVVTLVNEGTDIRNIIAGINNSVASRLTSMVRRVGLKESLVLTGGCSKNEGLAKALAGKLNVTINQLPQDPQLAGAVGAALLAAEKLAAERLAAEG